MPVGYDPNVDSLKERLVYARNALGITQEQLAQRAGVGGSTISNLEAGIRSSPRKLLDIAAALGVSAIWLEKGVGEMRLTAGNPPHDGEPVAHLLTLDRRTVPPTRTKAEIVSGTAGDLYAFTLDDDAMGPERPRGTEFVFDVAKKPSPGSLVLVVDAHHQLHAREYRQGAKPGEWTAAAVNRAYASFDGADVRLVATAKYLTLP